MGLTADLPTERRPRVDARLQTNLMAWLTTVSPAGRPASVPVWFLVRDDDSILVYSQPGKASDCSQDNCFDQKLGQDVELSRSDRFANANLLRSFSHRNQHDIHHANASDHQGDKRNRG